METQPEQANSAATQPKEANSASSPANKHITSDVPTITPKIKTQDGLLLAKNWQSSTNKLVKQKNNRSKIPLLPHLRLRVWSLAQ